MAAPNAAGQGQQGTGSPYSAYGFGELAASSQVTQASMGGTGVALADPYSVSRISPAAYPFLWLASFETGMVVRNLQYDTETLDAKGRATRFMGFSLGVPFGKGKWGLALGLNPMTGVGYKFNVTEPVEGGTVRYQYTGSGGLDRAFFGFGRVLWQTNDSMNRGSKLSVGANFEYLFGTVEESRKAYYPSGNGYYNASVASTLVMRSPGGTASLQYAGDLISLGTARLRLKARQDRARVEDEREEMEWLNAGKDPKERKPVPIPKGTPEALRFRLGLSMELPTSLTAWHTNVANNFVVSNAGVEFPRDTAHFIDGERGTIRLPALFGLGFTVYNTRWTVTAEHNRRDWTQVRSDVEGYDLRSNFSATSTYALGATYRPAGDGKGKFFQNTIYRMGARYANDYISVNGTALDQMAVSLGASFPLWSGGTRSRFNIGTQFGQRGTTDNGLLRERFADVFIGVCFTPDPNDRWFKRRRIE